MASRALEPAFDQRHPAFFESVADEVLASAFYDAGSDWQSACPIEVAFHSVSVGLKVADAGRDSFGPAAVQLQNGDHLSDCYYRVKTPQKRRSRIPQSGGCEFVPGGMPPERRQSKIPFDFSAEGGSSRVIKLEKIVMLQELKREGISISAVACRTGLDSIAVRENSAIATGRRPVRKQGFNQFNCFLRRKGREAHRRRRSVPAPRNKPRGRRWF